MVGCKLSPFDFKHKWSVHKLNVCRVNLICLFGSIMVLACCATLVPMHVLVFQIR